MYQVLTSSPILRQPDFDIELILYTDASGFALFAILAKKIDYGTEYVFSYASRTLKNANCINLKLF